MWFRKTPPGREEAKNFGRSVRQAGPALIAPKKGKKCNHGAVADSVVEKQAKG